MRGISTYEHKILQEKLERIERALILKECDSNVQEIFSLEEIKAMRKDLKKLFTSYARHYTQLEEIIDAYFELYNRTAVQVRVKYRILNRKLDDNLSDRELLGLPPLKPVKVQKLNYEAENDRSRHYKTRKQG
jgi:hypothetical protein